MSRIPRGNGDDSVSSHHPDDRTSDGVDTAAAAVDRIVNASLPCTPAGSRWDVHFAHHRVTRTVPHDGAASAGEGADADDESNAPGSKPCSIIIDAHGALLAPSLCHPHVHLDKAFLLGHPKYADLAIERGDFAEAMALTERAKARVQHDDLLERGQRLIDESAAAGVTHMRAFVEIDAGVGTTCLEAGIALQQAADVAGRMHIQLCAFAQLPLFSPSPGDADGAVVRRLMERAIAAGVPCIGSTPYVEADRARMEQNVDWMVDLSARYGLHLDFHLDYHLNPATEPMVWYVVASLRRHDWLARSRALRKTTTTTATTSPSLSPLSFPTVVLGHCTRLALFTAAQWQDLQALIADLPVSFVGLPTSDLFMMRTRDRVRGTLDIPRLVTDYGVCACIGMNNIGNAFTPHGSCDPLTLACHGVGIYHAGTRADAALLYECVSTRARDAIGLGRNRQREATGADRHGGANAAAEGPEASASGLAIAKGDANFVLFGTDAKADWRTRKTVAEAVYLYDHCQGRRGILEGKLVT